jgi:hypothetical protein
MFVTPLPFVRRVIFLSTPHRGSYVAGSWLAHQVARLIALPFDLTHRVTDIVRRNEKVLKQGRQRFQTSVDNMTPGNLFIKTLADLPIVPPAVGHSIIAVQGAGPQEEGDDGVVEFESAHIDGVDLSSSCSPRTPARTIPDAIDECAGSCFEHLRGAVTAPTG